MIFPLTLARSEVGCDSLALRLTPPLPKVLHRERIDSFTYSCVPSPYSSIDECVARIRRIYARYFCFIVFGVLIDFGKHCCSD